MRCSGQCVFLGQELNVDFEIGHTKIQLLMVIKHINFIILIGHQWQPSFFTSAKFFFCLCKVRPNSGPPLETTTPDLSSHPLPSIDDNNYYYYSHQKKLERFKIRVKVWVGGMGGNRSKSD